ncbi:pf02656 domain containing protein [Neofusicoccum parvum]|uniref:Pf02656 domain containing protein n=1 Tax=Neofusicoccum parvum TaxID=310453 RepID=A0ACB5SHI9_9PEZI|nr:pf02656 domain containing protein [Neofusicoccum parvum]
MAPFWKHTSKDEGAVSTDASAIDFPPSRRSSNLSVSFNDTVSYSPSRRPGGGSGAAESAAIPGVAEMERRWSAARQAAMDERKHDGNATDLERTFLAWLRTSLSFASIGIAVTQLFRLNTSIAPGDDNGDQHERLRHVGKPLGATFIAISIVILFIGFHRYFESQHYVIRGKFPATWWLYWP